MLLMPVFNSDDNIDGQVLYTNVQDEMAHIINALDNTNINMNSNSIPAVNSLPRMCQKLASRYNNLSSNIDYEVLYSDLLQIYSSIISTEAEVSCNIASKRCTHLEDLSLI